MFKCQLFIFITVALMTKLFATSQVPDKIIYNGKEFLLHSNPMDSFFSKYPEKYPRGGGITTANWRGYIAHFEFKGKKLALKDLTIRKTIKKDDGEYKSYRQSVIDTIAPKGQQLHINWFTGILVLPFGKQVQYMHLGYGTTYSDYHLLEIKKGILTNSKTLTLKDYEVFKDKQFQAYKKTAAYREILKEFDPEKWTPRQIDKFLRNYIIRYTSEFLDEEKESKLAE